MPSVRPPAVAGLFYPDDSAQLRGELESLLAAEPADGPCPKALIVPHAGYVYSGPVAAKAYARLRGAQGIRRVLLVGSAHRVSFAGLALPEADAFATPLGEMTLDREGLQSLAALPFVQFSDLPHAQEHSLEVQLPFLQVVLGEVGLLPALAGEASVEEMVALFEALWGGPETLILVSSDLSHFLPYEEARHMDGETCRMIENLDSRGWRPERACGALPILGLLEVARRRGMAVETLDLRNSGDTAGGREQVVGYGAWAFTEGEAR